MYDPTDIVDELNRKTFEAIQWALKSYSQGEISHSECAVAIKAIWTTVAGLVPREVQETLDDCLNKVKTVSSKHVVVLASGNKIVMVSMVFGGKTIKLSVLAPTVSQKVTELIDSSEANKKFDAMVDQLVKQGWTKIFGESGDSWA